MSNFVELPIEQYSTTAFNNFDPAAGNFKIANARALMWFSQLAYEGAKGATIEAVRQTWNFASIFSFNIPKIDVVASFDTMGIVGERADAIVLAFAGTDPAVWETLATDFNIKLTPDMDTHIGFQTAADAARPEIIRAITMSKQTGKPLLIAWAQPWLLLLRVLRPTTARRRKRFTRSACRGPEVSGSKRPTMAMETLVR